MVKNVDPSDIGKQKDLIKIAQKEMASSDIHVCGKCHSVFQFVELFLEHREGDCDQDPVFRDSKETKPKVWAFLLWKAAQTGANKEEHINAWKLYQNWLKLDDATRETWIVAGRTIQSFTRFGQGQLHETPVKITKTVVDTVTKPNPPKTNEPKTVAASKPIAKPIVRQVLPKVSPKLEENKTQLQKSAVVQQPATKLLTKVSSPVKVVKKQPITRPPLATKLSTNQSLVNGINRMARKTIPNSNNETVEHKIEKILAKRFNPRRKEQEYLIKWDDLPHEDNTWEAKSNLDNCPELLDTFEKQLAKQKAQRLALQAKQEQLEAEKKAAAEAKAENNEKSTPPPTALAKTVSNVTTASLNTTASSIESASPLTNKSTDESPTRLTRSSKTKALHTIQNWSADSNDEATNKKRKLDDSDYDDAEEGDSDRSLQNNDKKESSQTKEPPTKMVKTDTAAIARAFIKAGHSGSVSIAPVSKATAVASTPVTNSIKVNDGTKTSIEKHSADVIITNTKDNKPTGIVKKPGATVNSAKQNEAQVQVVQKSDSATSGVVRISDTANQVRNVPTTARQPGIPPKPTINTRPAAARPIANRPSPQPTKTPPSRPGSAIQNQITRTSLSPVTQSSSPGTSKVVGATKVLSNTTQKTLPNIQNQKLASLDRQNALKITQKTVTTNANTSTSVKSIKIDDTPVEYDLSELFPKSIHTVSSPSPTQELTLCPITGKVLGQAEGEPTPQPSPEPIIEIKKTTVTTSTTKTTQAASTPIVSSIEDASGVQLQEVLTNDDGTPMLVSEDGTVYQVAGKNEQGQTVLITQGEDGEQQFVYVANEEDDDDASGLMAAMAGDGDAIGGQTETIVHQPGQGQMLTIQTAGEEGQITAEVIQADLPSPGGTRKVVLMLPDGNFVMANVSDEQYQSFNLTA